MSDIVDEMGGYLGDGSEFEEQMPENTRSSELEDILLKFASSEMDEMGVQQGAISENRQLFTLDEAKATLEALIASKVTELDNLKLVCNAELPSTYTDPLTGKKLYNEAYVASKVEEARKADSHHWDSETFAPITVCIRCATTFQIRGNKPCKGKMAKVALREPEALQSKEGDS